MKYTKPDIILQSVTRLEERNAWEIKMRVIFRNIGSHILTLPIPMEKILDGGVRPHSQCRKPPTRRKGSLLPIFWPRLR